MEIIIGILIITFISIFLIAYVKEEWKGMMALFAVSINGILSSCIAIPVLVGDTFEQSFFGGNVFGNIAIRVDALSAWFILLMNFTVLTGILYGRRYMKHYEKQDSKFTLHFVSYIINHFAMIGIYCLRSEEHTSEL